MDDGDCCVAALCSSSFHENLSLFSSPSKEQSLHLLLFTRISQARCYGQHCNSFPSGQNKNFQFGISENNDLFQTKKKIIQSGFQWKKNLLSSKYEFVSSNKTLIRLEYFKFSVTISLCHNTNLRHEFLFFTHLYFSF